MANIRCIEGFYHVRFRYQGVEFNRSLKTSSPVDAMAGKNIVEQTIYRLKIGVLIVPAEIDLGDFIVSGGTMNKPIPQRVPSKPLISTATLMQDYLASQQNLLSATYLYSQKVHLRHLVKHLGELAKKPCEKISFRDLDAYLKKRLSERHPHTAERERITIRQFFHWLATQGYLKESPAIKLLPIKGGVDQPPFRTIDEIDLIQQRGGLTEEERFDLWNCLYLKPDEIAQLLTLVKSEADWSCGYLLHAIPAYTGMRRGEVIRLKWIDVDLSQEFLYARSRKQSRRKTETVRRIDLHPELKEILSTWKKLRSTGQFVISDPDSLEPLTGYEANRQFWLPMRGSTWCLHRRRNLFKIGFHTYRHSFASNLAGAGVDQRVIDEWMGHQTDAMRKRYRHLFPQQRQSAIRAFSLGQPAALRA
ncbi:MAG: site-specific integrase [Gemmatales bacterium]